MVKDRGTWSAEKARPTLKSSTLSTGVKLALLHGENKCRVTLLDFANPGVACWLRMDSGLPRLESCSMGLGRTGPTARAYGVDPR